MKMVIQSVRKKHICLAVDSCSGELFIFFEDYADNLSLLIYQQHGFVDDIAKMHEQR